MNAVQRAWGSARIESWRIRLAHYLEDFGGRVGALAARIEPKYECHDGPFTFHPIEWTEITLTHDGTFEDGKRAWGLPE